jgi:hypothetical protein
MNPDLERGALFRCRARELLDFLRQQPKPYLGSETSLAKALFIGERSIRRYLRFLQASGLIKMEYRKCLIENGSAWRNHRKILLLEDESGIPKNQIGQ